MSSNSLDPKRAQEFVERLFEDSIVPTLEEYIRIPNKSPAFDAEWEAHGHMEKAVSLISTWCEKNAVPGTTVEVVRLEGRTPVILMEVPGSVDDTVLLYGHLDKQPEMVGWSDGLGPWTPVRRGDRLYGRGGADDGYAAFASLTALKLLHDQGVAHARAVILIEACEESGSYDLPLRCERNVGDNDRSIDGSFRFVRAGSVDPGTVTSPVSANAEFLKTSSIEPAKKYP